jgi:hypothetical protein
VAQRRCQVGRARQEHERHACAQLSPEGREDEVAPRFLCGEGRVYLFAARDPSSERQCGPAARAKPVGGFEERPELVFELGITVQHLKRCEAGLEIFKGLA